jgi:cell division initiation protein
MKLTPQEIMTQQFNMKSKGYDKDEVTNFLMEIAERLENEILDKERLKKKISKLKDVLSKFEKREGILKDTLIAAQKFSQEIKVNAEKEADLVIKEAEMKGEEIISRAIGREQAIREEIRSLKFKRREIENEIVSMLNRFKELIESYHQDDEEFDKVEYLGK